MAEADQLVELLKEIRDELRAVRTELGTRGSRMTMSGVRTAVLARQGRWRSAALAAGGVVGLALVIGLVMRDRPAPSPLAVAPSAPIPAQAPVIPAAPVAEHAAIPVAKPPAPAPAARQAARLPAGAPAPATLASAPAPAKKRVRPDVAAMSPGEVASDEDEPLAFSPPPRRVRVHRLSYGPVESEPAKL